MITQAARCLNYGVRCVVLAALSLATTYSVALTRLLPAWRDGAQNVLACALRLCYASVMGLYGA